MTFFRNLPIARKLAAAFGLVCLLTILLGWMSLRGMAALNASTVDLDTEWLPSIRVLGDLRAAANTNRRLELELLLCEDDSCMTEARNHLAQGQSDFDAVLTRYSSLISSDDQRAIEQRIRQTHDEYLDTSGRVVTAASAGQHEVASHLALREGRDRFSELLQQIALDVALNDRGAATATTRAADLYRFQRILVIAIIVLAVLLSGFAGWILTRIVARPLLRAVALLGKVANKDLTDKLEVGSSDEVGQLSASLNATVDSMREVLSAITRSTELLASATNEISAGASESANNAKGQAAHVQQVASTMEEMTSTVAEISRNAQQAAVASRESAGSATDGGRVVDGTVSAIQRIHEGTTSVGQQMESLGNRSEEIGRAVIVIRDIAEQTNLLALNAAIESARAGEHGRGFAVVAGEVRRLSERTRAATEEISGMVEMVQAETRKATESMASRNSDVDEGLKMAAQASDALKAIIETSVRTESMVNLIAAAATEQSSASGEISRTVVGISENAQHSATAATQTASASEELSRLATELEGLVCQFRLDDNRQFSAPSPDRCVPVARAVPERAR